MYSRTTIVTCFVLVLLAATAPEPAHAQILERIKERARQAVEEEVDRALEGAGDEAADDTPPREGRPGAGRPSAATAADEPPAGPSRADEGQVLFFEDFDRTAQGDFPASMHFVFGSASVADFVATRMLTTDGLREDVRTMLRVQSDADVLVPLQAELPEAFTISFDLKTPHNWTQVYVLTGALDARQEGRLHAKNGAAHNYGATHFLAWGTSGIRGGRGGESVAEYAPFVDGVTPVRIEVNGAKAKMWVGDRMVGHVPNADVRRGDVLRLAFRSHMNTQAPVYLDNLRVTGVVPELSLASADLSYRTIGPLSPEEARRRYDRMEALETQAPAGREALQAVVDRARERVQRRGGAAGQPGQPMRPGELYSVTPDRLIHPSGQVAAQLVEPTSVTSSFNVATGGASAVAEARWRGLPDGEGAFLVVWFDAPEAGRYLVEAHVSFDEAVRVEAFGPGGSHVRHADADGRPSTVVGFPARVEHPGVPQTVVFVAKPAEPDGLFGGVGAALGGEVRFYEARVMPLGR